MGPISCNNKSKSILNVQSKHQTQSKGGSPGVMSNVPRKGTLFLGKGSKKNRLVDTEHCVSSCSSRSKTSPRSISQFPTSRQIMIDEEEGDASSTGAVGSPRRSIHRLPVNSIINYTNQACEALDSSQHTLAMRLLKDAHNLLHRSKDSTVQQNGARRKKVCLLIGSRHGHQVVQSRNDKSPDADFNFVPSNSYIYQRLEFDEGMNTFSKPFKIHGGCRSKGDEMRMDSIIWYNKGHIYVHCHSWEKAITCFQSSIETNASKGRALEQDGDIQIAAIQSIAQIQYRLGKYEEAIVSYKKAIKYAKKIHGEIHETIGAGLNSLSVLYYHLMSSGRGAGKSDNYLKYARDYSEKSLAIRIQTLGLGHKDVGTTYNNIGRLHVMQGKFKKAIRCYEKALQIRADALSKNSLDYAATAFNAGQSYHHIHDLSKALTHYEGFLSVAVRHFTRNHRDVAVVLSGIAEIHQERGDMEEALRLYQESLEAGRNALGEQHPEVAMILNRLGNFHFQCQRYDEAYEAYEQGLKIERGLSDDTNGIVSLCNLGEIHRQRKEWNLAIKVFKAVVKVQQKKFGKVAQNAEIATTLNVIGLTYDKKGDSGSALKYLQEALLMRRVALGGEHIDCTPILTTIGIIFFRNHKLNLALDVLNESLNIRLTILGKDHRDVAFTLYNIALTHQKQGSLTEAISCFMEVLRVERSVLGNEHKDVAITLFKLAETYKRGNDLDRALIYYQDALKIERKVMRDNEPLTIARTLTEIGNIHLSRGQRTLMMEAFNEAARIYQSSSMSPHHVAVARRLYAIDLVCPRGAPAA